MDAVRLDTNLTHDLLVEGERNEIVHRVNTIRKKQGFKITDRIKLTLPRDNQFIQELITTHANYIASEVLASQIEVGDELCISPPDLGIHVSEEIQTAENIGG